MIGLFAINSKNDVCFVQYGHHQKISLLRVVPGNSCVAQLDDGTEEMFTTELNAEILAAVRILTELLVVHMSDDGEPVDEYVVPLQVKL